MTLPRLDVSRSPQDRFADFLQSRGMRDTRQRQTLLAAVFKQQHHFDADQLIEQLPRRGQQNYVSRPTVYRTLGEFVEAGLLKKFDLDGRCLYEHDYGYPEHDHLLCLECRRLFEFENDALKKLVGEIALQAQFQVQSQRLIVEGVCIDCRRNHRRERKRVDLI